MKDSKHSYFCELLPYGFSLINPKFKHLSKTNVMCNNENIAKDFSLNSFLIN